MGLHRDLEIIALEDKLIAILQEYNCPEEAHTFVTQLIDTAWQDGFNEGLYECLADKTYD